MSTPDIHDFNQFDELPQTYDGGAIVTSIPGVSDVFDDYAAHREKFCGFAILRELERDEEGKTADIVFLVALNEDYWSYDPNTYKDPLEWATEMYEAVINFRLAYAVNAGASEYAILGLPIPGQKLGSTRYPIAGFAPPIGDLAALAAKAEMYEGQNFLWQVSLTFEIVTDEQNTNDTDPWDLYTEVSAQGGHMLVPTFVDENGDPLKASNGQPFDEAPATEVPLMILRTSRYRELSDIDINASATYANAIASASGSFVFAKAGVGTVTFDQYKAKINSYSITLDKYKKKNGDIIEAWKESIEFQIIKDATTPFDFRQAVLDQGTFIPNQPQVVPTLTLDGVSRLPTPFPLNGDGDILDIGFGAGVVQPAPAARVVKPNQHPMSSDAAVFLLTNKDNLVDFATLNMS